MSDINLLEAIIAIILNAAGFRIWYSVNLKFEKEFEGYIATWHMYIFKISSGMMVFCSTMIILGIILEVL